MKLLVPRGSPPADRFWAHVRKGDGCWEWTGSCPQGYGSIKISGRLYRAHRFSWELANGSIPAGKSILHRCDNPACVRPDHLFLGSQQDNVTDMKNKGRADPRTGERNTAAKLREDQVREIRRRADAGESARSIASDFGVSAGTVHFIARRIRWTHVPEEASRG